MTIPASRHHVAGAAAGAAFWRLTAGRKSLTQVLEHLGSGLPTGVFSNRNIHPVWRPVSAQNGFTNDFRQLKTRLTLVATNLDTGEAAPFGSPGWDHVPISQAVQASSALPGLYPPVEIDDQYYVDGALKKTLHASVALDQGVDLMLCLNPLVPFDATVHPLAPRVMQRGLAHRAARIPRIVDGGLPSVLSQTFRSMIHSRMALGMKHYERAYPDTDIVLIEPDHRDPELYLANTFSYRSAAIWRSMPSSRRARCCARARPCCRPSWHATASPSTMPHWTTRKATCVRPCPPHAAGPCHCFFAGCDGRYGPDGGPATAPAAATTPWPRKRPAAPPSASWK
jgi:predicted acylesterase/phospholipase RssA